ncbi:hypothetical protein DW215_00865 [Parabacteroides sp. AM18-12LB]|nr:hypothetical protein DW215_00865 [Parabacteroides sp. AM18-12LB]
MKNTYVFSKKVVHVFLKTRTCFDESIILFFLMFFLLVFYYFSIFVLFDKFNEIDILYLTLFHKFNEIDILYLTLFLVDLF